MKVIRISANANGSRPALFDFSGDIPPSGCAFIPESFVPEFYKEGKEAFGFVNISVEGNTVTSCEWDETAYQAFLDASPKVPDTPTPSQLREDAYNTQALIPWDGEMLTVTQAAQQWQYYAAEGNTEKTDELTALIAAAKQAIREQYPDEEGGT